MLSSMTLGSDRNTIHRVLSDKNLAPSALRQEADQARLTALPVGNDNAAVDDVSGQFRRCSFKNLLGSLHNDGN